MAAPKVRTDLPASDLKPGPIESYSPSRPKSPFVVTSSLGYSMGPQLEYDEPLSTSFLGINIRQNRFETGEIDIWLNNANLVGIFAGARYIFSDDSVQKSYSKLSAGMYLSPDEGFVNFITIKRLQVRGAIGWENFLDVNHSLSVEAGLGAAIIGFEYFAHLGWNWFF
ncbi:MAG: hypothetical protein ACLGGX_04515 [Bdellovibrionia bacterium]